MIDTHPRSGAYYRSTATAEWDRQILPRGEHEEGPHQKHLFHNFAEHPPKAVEWSAARSCGVERRKITVLRRKTVMSSWGQC